MNKKEVFKMTKKWVKFRLSEQHALYPVRVEMQVDFTDNETTEESFVEDIETVSYTHLTLPTKRIV